ncbi:MAG: NAD(P)H-binding protein [Bacteroidetes bacterium]|nr:NAD(P)H-binding protein [Bacteroidota bacterium]
MKKIALLAGSTGLVGSQVLDLLLKSDSYSSVIALSRKKLRIESPKLVNVICSLSELAARANELRADDVFCCLGTTIKQAKSKEAFRAVDYEAPWWLAKITQQEGAKKFILVSALGASKESSLFYNRVKGEVEEAIAAVGFECFHILRPSLLVGPRTEKRSGEDAAKIFFKFFGWAVPKKYKAIESIKVARAMVSFAGETNRGTIIHESNELQTY